MLLSRRSPDGGEYSICCRWNSGSQPNESKFIEKAILIFLCKYYCLHSASLSFRDQAMLKSTLCQFCSTRMRPFVKSLKLQTPPKKMSLRCNTKSFGCLIDFVKFVTDARKRSPCTVAVITAECVGKYSATHVHHSTWKDRYSTQLARFVVANSATTS